MRFDFGYFLDLNVLSSFDRLYSLVLGRLSLVSLFYNDNFFWSYSWLGNFFDNFYLSGFSYHFNYFLTLRLSFNLGSGHLWSLSHWDLSYCLYRACSWLLCLSWLLNCDGSWLHDLSLWLLWSYLSGGWLALLNLILDLFKLLWSQTCCQTSSLLWLQSFNLPTLNKSHCLLNRLLN